MPNIIIDFCKDYKNLPLNIPFLLKFKLDGIYKWIGGNEHTISLSCSNRAVLLSTKKVIIEEGWKFATYIEASNKGNARIEIYVDGVLNKTIDFNFVDGKDLFKQADYDIISDEMNYIKPFADVHSPSEYIGNYCMSAAERGLSKLLKNDIDFYSVERITHKRKNKVGFSNKTADDRAKIFQTKGFIQSLVSFPTKDFSIKLNKTFDIDSTDGSSKDRDTIIVFKNEDNVYQTFLKNIRNEMGYHIYYCSIAGANHTMILIIDYNNPCDAKYEMWDQHGRSSSHGKLPKIANGESGSGGINAQVQWLVRWLRGVKKTEGAAKADTFYPQLTCTFYKLQIK